MPTGRFGRLDESWPVVIQFNRIAHISKLEKSNLINLKTFPIDSKEIDTSIRSIAVVARVQMPCRLAWYSSFRTKGKWKEW